MFKSRKSKILVAVAALVTAGVIGGGIAYAVIAPAPTPLAEGDTMYACVTSGGKVRGARWWLNTPPATCPSAGDTVRSWEPVTDLSDYYTKGEADASVPGVVQATRCSARYPGANLATCNLPYANLEGANLRGANLTGAYLTNANLTGAGLSYANLTGANLLYANLTGANLLYANLSFNELEGADLYSADLTGANLTNANLRGANLLYAILSGANLTGVSWWNTICPNGVNSDNNYGTCIGSF
jgi:hypothetical protein